MAFMAKFNVGDICERVNDNCWTVDHVNGAYIKITSIGTGYKYDILDKKFNKVGHCSYCLSNKDLKLYEPAKKEKEIEPFYVDCPTKEIWDRVEQKMFEMGYEWCNGAKKVPFDEYGFEECKNMCVGGIEDIGHLGNKIFRRDQLDTPNGHKHIPYQEFLGEDKKDNVGGFKVGDRIRLVRTGYTFNGSFGTITKFYEEDGVLVDVDNEGGDWCCSFDQIEKVEVPKTPTEAKGNTLTLKRLLEIYEESEKYYPPSNFDLFPYFPGKPIKSFTQRIMATLRSIPDRLKRALNANLRAFYKLGWIDGDLDVTETGESELRDFLFDKFEKELGAIAAKKVKDASKKKKDEDEDTEDEE